MIENVVYGLSPEINRDSRRNLTIGFNGDLGGFVARQMKVAEMLKEGILGGHYHTYAELFLMVQGEARFELEEIESKVREEYLLTPGQRLVIPVRVAHRAYVKEGTILVGCTGEVHVKDKSDIKYDF